LLSFIITPLLVLGLGDYSFGLWQIMGRMVSFLAPAGGRPTHALRSTLARHQSSTDYEQKRSYVGSTFIAWLFFLPGIGIAGGLLAWFSPQLLRVPLGQEWVVRVAAALLLVSLVITNWAAIPRAVLQGENQSYRRMGLSATMVFIGGAFTWIALYFKTGIIGIAAAALLSQILTGLFFFQVVRSFIPWYGVVWPRFDQAREFIGLTGWFLAWDSIQTLMLTSDVIVLGLFTSVEAVTPYTLTKSAPELLISMIAIITIGIAPGLGGILGSGDLKKAAQVRGEIMSVTWLISTSLGSTILLWNHAFINLWVGDSKYAGMIPNLLIVLMVSQLILIRNDASIIDLTLRLKQKVWMGALSLTISIIAASLLVGYFDFGIIGLCLGMMAGRSILSVGYPLLISHFLEIPISSQLRSIIRPLMVTCLIFGSMLITENSAKLTLWPGVRTWIGFFMYAGISGIIVLMISFFTGLTTRQRLSLLRRVEAMRARPQTKRNMIPPAE